MADSFFILPDKPIVNTYAYEATTNLNVELKTPILPETPVSFTTVRHFPETNQLRRSVNQFIDAVRPRPYKPYLHYNSWMDIGFFTPYSEQDVIGRMDEWNKEFIAGRGWRWTRSCWTMAGTIAPDAGCLARHSATVLAKSGEKADSLHSSVGLWLSPWGGYNKPRDIRVSHAKEYGFETVDGKLALSGPNYFKTLTIRSSS